MADANTTGARGLTTGVNPLVSQGNGFYQLQNSWTDMNGWASKRRGMKQLNATSAWTGVFSGGSMAARDVWFFDDHLFVYAEGSTTNGIAAYSFVTSAGWHKVVEQTNPSYIGLDTSEFYSLRSCPSDRRQLLNTKGGVKRIASIYNDYYPRGSTTAVNYSSMYRDAGIPRALEPRCRNAVAGGATDHGLIALTALEWLPVSSAVAYRIVWFKRDENGIPGVGAPSGRIVVRNTSTTTTYATRLKVVIPDAINDSSYVMQIYRTNVIQIDGAGIIPDPGDDMFLSGEYRLTSTDLSNGYVLYEDVSFDPLLGDALYSNENQEGVFAARFQPPLSRDIAMFGGCAHFANITERQRLTLKILAVDPAAASKGVRIGDVIVAGDLAMIGVATADEELTGYNFAVDATAGTGSEVIRALKTAESLVYKYNLWSNTNNGRYAAYNLTSNNDIYGVVGFEEKSVGGTTGVYVGLNRVDAPVQILPIPTFTTTPSNTLALKCAVATNGSGVATIDAAGAAHNLTTGDLVFLAPWAASTEAGTSSPQFVNTNVPSGVYQITVVDADEFTITGTYAASQTDADAATTGGYFHKIFDFTTSVWTEARSKISYQPNRLMWSPLGEPESAPIVNFADIGAADKAILRIIPTQDSLFIFKEDGLWRLKGFGGDWEIVVLDAACVLYGAETPAVVNGRVFALTTAGVVAVDDGGSQIVSGDIAGEIARLRSASPSREFAFVYRGCGHGEQNAYWLAFGASAFMYRYHIPTRTWSKHVIMPPAAKTDGTGTQSQPIMCTAKASRYTSFDAQSYAERLVVAHGTSATSGAVSIERRTGLVIDLSDVDIPAGTVSSLGTSDNTVTLASAPAATEVGDIFMWYTNATNKPAGYSFSAASTIRATISAINGNVLSLAVSGTVPAVSTWPAISGSMSGSIIKQIRSVVGYNPFLVDQGMNAGRFNEVLLSTGSLGRFSECTLGFNTETATAVPLTEQATSTMSGFAYADWTTIGSVGAEASLPYLRTFRSGVPRATAIGSYLLVTLHHNRACEHFDVAGLKVIIEEGSNKTRKTNA